MYDDHEYRGRKRRSRLVLKDRHATTTPTSNRKTARVSSSVSTAVRWRSRASKHVKSLSLPEADDLAGWVHTRQHAGPGQKFGATPHPPAKNLGFQGTCENPLVHSTGARARGARWPPPAPGARRDPLTAPATSALPARAVPSLRPPQRPGGRNPGGRARGHRTYTQRLTEATSSRRGAPAASPNVSDGAARRASTFLWRPSPTQRRQPPPPHLPGPGKWPRPHSRPHSLHGTNYHARSDRLAAPASPFRIGARARRPRPPGARAGA